jgi:gp16 family phage-associated protein
MQKLPRCPRRPAPGAPLRSREEARAWFLEQGTSIASWARGVGVSPSLVYDVLSGRDSLRCTQGHSHRVAVLLGLKRGRIATARRA